MDLHMHEIPAEMTTRRRVVEFKRDDLILILSDYCRTQGVEISTDCKLSVWRDDLYIHNNGVVLCIDGG